MHMLESREVTGVSVDGVDASTLNSIEVSTSIKCDHFG